MGCLSFLMGFVGCGSNSNTIPSISGLVANALPPNTLKSGATSITVRPATGHRGVQTAQAVLDLDNVMSVFWNQKTGACSSSDVSAGNCFTSSTGRSFYKPTPLIQSCVGSYIWNLPSADPANIVDNSSLQQACEFDNTAGMSGSDQCSDSNGASLNLGYFVPWYASWGLPQTDTFHGASSPAGQSGPIQDYKWYKLQTSSDLGFGLIDLQISNNALNRINTGYRNTSSNTFFYLRTMNATVPGGTIPTLSAFMGQAPDAGGSLNSNAFESYFVNQYINSNLFTYRVKSDGTYLYYEYWAEDPSNPTAPTGWNSPAPTSTGCYIIGASIDQIAPSSSMQDCLTAFGVSAESDLRNDTSWHLQIVPASSISTILDAAVSSGTPSAATLSAVNNNTSSCY